MAIGEKMPRWVDDGTQEYQKRMPPEMRVQFEDVPAGKRARATVAQCINEEAAAIRKRLNKYSGAHIVALEVKGKRLGTEQLAEKLGACKDMGQDMVMLVGGPDGLCPELSASAHERWSLSALTLPHPLVRVVMAEQLYRGWTLLSGHPYHR